MQAAACHSVTVGAVAVDAWPRVWRCGSRAAVLRTRRVRAALVAVVPATATRRYTAIPLAFAAHPPAAPSSSLSSSENATTHAMHGARGTSPHLSAAGNAAYFSRSPSPTSQVPAALLRVREAPRAAPHPTCVRVPRLLVFGGDVVSVTALEALHARMRCIVREALRCVKAAEASSSHATGSAGGATHWRTPTPPCTPDAAEQDARQAALDAEVEAFVRDHITVVCPALPRGITPEGVARKFTRQYPVARYCVEHGLPIIPVDDPKSLTRSALLKEMLASSNAAAAGAAAPAKGASAQHVRRTHQGAPPVAHHAPAPDRDGSAGSPSSSSTAHTWAAQGRPLSDYDLTVVVSFRYFLPQRLLRVLPPVINMHPSLLPRYRGASPIFSALRHNESVGGVSIIQMKPEQKMMDSGSVLWQCEVPITADMDIRLYFPLVTQIGAAGLCDLIFGEAPPSPSTVVAATVDGCRSGDAAAPARGDQASTRTCGEREAIGRVCDGAKRSDCARDKAAVPPWLALRQRSLVPAVCRHDGGPPPPPSTAAAGPASESLPPSGGAPALPAHHHTQPLFNVAELPLLAAVPGPVTTYPLVRIRHLLCAIEGGASSLPGEAAAAPVLRAAPPSAPCCHPWKTLCRAATHITPEAVRAASTAHRALFFQNLESATAGGAATSACAPSHGRRESSAGKRKGGGATKKHVSASAAAEMAVSTTMKCAEVFPHSVLSPHCDWPDSFTYSWKFAQVQAYETYAHFTDDPHHAPLLPKDAAVVRFSSLDAEGAFGVWRAFVGGDYFQPSVNATLDKGSTPVRNQLVHRAVRRMLRERARAQHPRGSGASQPQPPPPAVVTAAEGSGAAADVPVGMVTGKHVELDVFCHAGLQLLAEAENTLRIPCTFTRVTNPALVPACVRVELAEVERSGCLPPLEPPCADSGNGGSAPPLQCSHPQQQQQQRRTRFYRAPPPIFRSLLCSRGRAAAASPCAPSAARAEATPRRESCADDSARAEDAAEEPGEDEEAPEDYVPEVIHAAPPTPHCIHVPPGTGYFPESDERYGAVKCKEGWLLWTEAHMKWANRAQPAVLIRKGLAMKTGVLYVGLFSEYS